MPFKKGFDLTNAHRKKQKHTVSHQIACAL